MWPFRAGREGTEARGRQRLWADLAWPRWGLWAPGLWEGLGGLYYSLPHQAASPATFSFLDLFLSGRVALHASCLSGRQLCPVPGRQVSPLPAAWEEGRGGGRSRASTAVCPGCPAPLGALGLPAAAPLPFRPRLCVSSLCLLASAPWSSPGLSFCSSVPFLFCAHCLCVCLPVHLCLFLSSCVSPSLLITVVLSPVFFLPTRCVSPQAEPLRSGTTRTVPAGAPHPGEPVHAGQQPLVPRGGFMQQGSEIMPPGAVHALRQRSLVRGCLPAPTVGGTFWGPS